MRSTTGPRSPVASSTLSVLTTLSTITLLSACGGSDSPSHPPEAKPVAVACPAEVPATATCLGGRDSAGAYYLIATPKDWGGNLILHAHGGPDLAAPTAERAREDPRACS
ncbi:hypothetical protein [Acidovorax sp.]|uniref:hypothetical protein n=1 Tax=Acidovorax sp. TaxID=1872122 RepID=UPI002ACD21E6|nr:hypothetical protein [Acidovorax sp.]MDZ7865742.1 hypothetical protein [Acidovorax sp.]